MAALAQDYHKPEPFEVPEGGLASFLTATTGAWAEATNDDYIPETGIAGVKQVADKLAEYGRYEDEYMVHAAEGETVIPAQVLDLNPRLKAKLYKEMRDMGLDPERYVVGNELNSINPVTGQPEFFLKKLFKGVKKAVKKVVKVLKKAATVILPVALNAFFPGLGTIASGALGAGLGTLIQGGNLKDAFKAAAIGGVTGAIAGKISGKNLLPGSGSAATGTTAATTAATTGQTAIDTAQALGSGSGGLTPLASQVAEGLPGNTLTSSFGTELGSDFVGQAAQSAAPLAELGVTPAMQAQAAASTAAANAASSAIPSMADIGAGEAAGLNLGTTGTLPGTPAPTGVTAPAGTAAPATAGATTQAAAPAATGPLTSGQLKAALTDTRGFFESAGDAFSNLGQGNFSQFVDDLKQAFLPQNYTAENLRAFAEGNYPELVGSTDFEALAQTLRETAGPDMLRRYMPLAAAGVGTMYATGGFETPEFEPELPYGGVTGYNLLEQNAPRYAPGVYRYAANGGDISFPRRNGAIYGPGTETSDDIPAMLSDGEFVMTAKAVRGAGNGDREKGMQRMYDIMSRFEGGAIRG